MGYNRGYPPSTTPRLDVISSYRENLTKHDILEIKKYYLARVFTANFSWYMAVNNPHASTYVHLSKCSRYRAHKTQKIYGSKKPYRKLTIKAFTGPVSKIQSTKYCANHYW
jgi:hypothetical protein